MAVSLNIGSLRLLEIEVCNGENMIYKGKSDDALAEIKQLNANKVDGISPLKLYVDDNAIV